MEFSGLHSRTDPGTLPALTLHLFGSFEPGAGFGSHLAGAAALGRTDQPFLLHLVEDGCGPTVANMQPPLQH